MGILRYLLILIHFTLIISDYQTEYYDGVKMLESVIILDYATFWNKLFPPLSDAEIIGDFSQGA